LRKRFNSNTHTYQALLYRYRQFSERSIENLVNEQEWQSYPSEFNDPFDASIKIDYTLLSKKLFLERNINPMLEKLEGLGVKVSDEQIKTIRKSDDPLYAFLKHVAQYDKVLNGKEDEFAKLLSEQALKQTKSKFDQFRQRFQNGYLVVCFSELKDSILMWSHYAINHTGFCIQYNFQELGSFSPLSRLLNPVIYTDELFDATHYVLQPLIRKDHSFNNLFGIFSSISKSNAWEYEKEWRTVFPLGPNASLEDRLIRVPKPKALYLGAKASEENTQKLKEIAIIKNITLYQIRLSETSHGLNVDLLYDSVKDL